MRKIVLALLLVVALGLTALERGAWKNYVVIRWDYTDKLYPELSFHTNLWFRVYAHTNIAEPMANWPVIAVINGTNRQAKIEIAPGHWWFAMTASNWWGESVFSDALRLPGPPSEESKLFLGVE